MKISYFDYLMKNDVSVLVAEAIFSELYKDFSVKKISDAADTQSGGTPLRTFPDYYGGDIPWLKSGELNDGEIDVAEEYITDLGLKNSSAKLLPKGTLLLAMYGATAGRIGIINFEASTNQAVCALFPKKSITREYLFWFLRQHRYKFIEISKGGAQPNISQTVIKETLLPIPDINTQNKITDILFKIKRTNQLSLDDLPIKYQETVSQIFYTKNTVLKLSSETTLQLTLVKQLRQAFLREAMLGKLVPQSPNDEPASILLQKIKAQKEQLVKDKKLKKDKDLPPIKPEEIPYNIPESWEWCRLSEICTKIGSGSTPTGGNYSEKGIPFFRSQNIYNGGLVLNDIKFITKAIHSKMSGTAVFSNDLLLNITGGSLGRCALVPSNFIQGNVSQHVCIIRSIVIDFIFLHKLSLSPLFQKQIFNSTTGAGREGLPKYNLEQFIIPIPPLEEQHRIVAKLEQLMAKCDKLENSIKQSQQQANSLLQVALKEALQPKEKVANGEVVIPLPQQPVEEYQPLVVNLFFKRACLAAEITNQLHTEKTFGHTKLQKLQFLCEHAANMDLQNHYVKAAAGPYDYNFMHSIDSEFEKQGWFIAKLRENNKGIYYIANTNPMGYKSSYQQFFNTVDDKIQHLIDLFRNQKTDFCEVVATFYAVWVDLKTTQQEITPDNLIANFYKWHEKKERFNRKYLVNTIQWMLDKGIYPK